MDSQGTHLRMGPLGVRLFLLSEIGFCEKDISDRSDVQILERGIREVGAAEVEKGDYWHFFDEEHFRLC